VTTLPPPPAELAHLVRLIGADAMLRLIEARGGTRLYVPQVPDDASPIAADIGLEAARALAREYGGETIKVPTCKVWRARVYHARGLSYAKIARRLGCTESTVWRLLAPAATRATQLSLFR
jgi:hypothetical protein